MAAFKGQRKKGQKMITLTFIWWLMFWQVTELAVLWTVLTIAVCGLLYYPLKRIYERYL